LRERYSSSGKEFISLIRTDDISKILSLSKYCLVISISSGEIFTIKVSLLFCVRSSRKVRKLHENT
jgi:hypothetical protein